MLPDRVSNPGPLTYESGALPIALRGPAALLVGNQKCAAFCNFSNTQSSYSCDTFLMHALLPTAFHTCLDAFMSDRNMKTLMPTHRYLCFSP